MRSAESLSGPRLPAPVPRRVPRADLRSKSSDLPHIKKSKLDPVDPQVPDGGAVDTRLEDTMATARRATNGDDNSIVDSVKLHIPSEKSEHCQADAAEQCPLVKGVDTSLRRTPSFHPEPNQMNGFQPTLKSSEQDHEPNVRSMQQGTGALPPISEQSTAGTQFPHVPFSSIPISSEPSPKPSSQGSFFQRAKGE
ncbi:unnamed protein product [Echinostoma caproni]|uniref:Ran-binding protein 3-like n=1 Tax=Echinostoma caproni TaxID=27848 RepID=A0A183A2N9_9TREM|nr:unnamed protein product [Echinostoma caproni]